jgi:hypothetical protein
MWVRENQHGSPLLDNKGHLIHAAATVTQTGSYKSESKTPSWDIRIQGSINNAREEILALAQTMRWFEATIYERK